jgi:hypothetical protein
MQHTVVFAQVIDSIRRLEGFPKVSNDEFLEICRFYQVSYIQFAMCYVLAVGTCSGLGEGNKE